MSDEYALEKFTVLPQNPLFFETGVAIYDDDLALSVFSMVSSLESIAVDTSFSNIFVADSASVTSFQNIAIDGRALDIENNGLIYGAGNGVALSGFGNTEGGSQIINNGLIVGGSQGISSTEDIEIVNLPGGRIIGEAEEGILARAGNEVSIQNDGSIIGATTAIRAYTGLIENSGTIRGDQVAVELNSGSVRNDGEIYGAVLLGSGGGEYVGSDGFLAGHVDGGAGGDTLVAGATGDILVGGRGRDVLVGGPGPDVLNGNRGEDQISGGSGADVLNGGFMEDVIIGGPGDDQIRGGPSRDTFILSRNDGFDTIGFQRIDTLDISDFGFRGFRRDVEPRLERDGPDTLLDLGNGDGVRLEGIRPAQLDADNFIV